MKRIFIVAIALMVFGFTNAQQTRFGIKGGLNITKYGGGGYWDANSLVGFQVGGFAEIKIIERLAIQPEILFSAQGATLSPPFGDYDERLNYINVPVLAKFYITKQFTVEGGPQLGFLVSAEQEGHDAKGDFKSVDTGFNFGAGYNFTDDLSVNFRYTIGLSDILDYEFGTAGSPKNRVLALTMGYKF